MKSMTVELQLFATVPGSKAIRYRRCCKFGLGVDAHPRVPVLWKLGKLGRCNRNWSALVLLISVKLQSFVVRDPHHAGSGATSLYYLRDDALQDASGYFLLRRGLSAGMIMIMWGNVQFSCVPLGSGRS